MELFKLVGKIVIEGIEKAKDDLSSVSEKAKSIGDKVSNAGNTIAGVGKKLQPVTVAIGGIATAAIKTTADFDSAMSKVAAISGATGDDFDSLREKAREMGAKTKFSAAEAAEAMNYMAMAGWKTEDMLNGIDGIMNLAAASGESLGSTSDIVTDAMTAFGMAADGTSKVLKDGLEVEVSNTTRFADVLAAASSNANTNVAMMGESFKYVAPVAGSLGYSVEDVSTALGLMANSGIKASMAGTSLRTLFTNMSKPTDQMAIAMDALGVSLDDGKGNMKSLQEVMMDLRKGFGKLVIPQDEFNDSLNKLNAELESGEIAQKEYDSAVEDLIERAYGAEGAVKAQYAAMLAGKTGMSGLLSIVNASEDDFNKLTNAVYNSNGSVEEMAAIMQDNLNGQITILKSQLQELAISFGDMVMPKLRDVVGHLQKFVDVLNQMDDGQREMIIKIGLAVAAVAPALIIIGKLVAGIGSVISAFGAVTGVLAGLSAPVLAVVAVIGVLVGAFVTLWNTNEEFKNNVLAIWSSIKEIFAEASGSFSDLWNACLTVWNSIGKPIWDMVLFAISETTAVFREKMPEIKKFFSDATAGIKDTWNNHLKPVFDAIAQFLNDKVKPAFEFVFKTIILPLITNVFGAIKRLWEGTLKPIFDGICDFLLGIFTNDWEKAFQGILNIVTGIFNAIVVAIETPMNAAKDIVNKAIEYIKDKFNFKWELPKLKLPHFTISGSFNLNPPSVPSFGVDWYKKAMDNPMILNSPTAFGINKNGQLMAGGEAGSEVVSGKDTLMNMISEAVAAKNEKLENILLSILEYMPQLANMQMVTDTGALVGALAPGMDRELGKRAIRSGRGI